MAVLKRVEILSKNTFQVRDYVHLLMGEKRYAKKIHYSREAAAAVNKITGNRSRTNEQKIKASFGPESLRLQLNEDELLQYPIRRFTGNIHIVKEPSHEHDLGILNVLNKFKQQAVLGLDVEMTECSREIAYNRRSKRTRVVQIASETDAVVWQLKNFANLPSSLVVFLKSDILKVRITYAPVNTRAQWVLGII